jgi:hypothetical protein
MTSILKVDTIQDADGNNIINESGNTITVGASGDTTNVIGTLNKDGVAVANTPAFEARLSSSHAVATGTWTKINVNTEVYDTAGTYDNSTNYRWTPGVAGKYVIYGQVGFDSMSDHKYLYMALYKNGSQLWTDGTSLNQTSTSGTLGAATRGTWSIDLDADDYVELYAYHNNGNNRDASSGWCYFGGYKIVE